jgi:acetyl esterase/lipase
MNVIHVASSDTTYPENKAFCARLRALRSITENGREGGRKHGWSQEVMRNEKKIQ